MSTYKKINKKTGEVALEYIVYDTQDGQEVEIDLYSFWAEDTTYLAPYIASGGNVMWRINNDGRLYIMMANKGSESIDVAYHVELGGIHVPHEVDSNGALIEDVKHNYTPDELKVAYPSELYDTVEVEE